MRRREVSTAGCGIAAAITQPPLVPSSCWARAGFVVTHCVLPSSAAQVHSLFVRWPIVAVPTTSKPQQQHQQQQQQQQQLEWIFRFEMAQRESSSMPTTTSFTAATMMTASSAPVSSGDGADVAVAAAAVVAAPRVVAALANNDGASAAPAAAAAPGAVGFTRHLASAWMAIRAIALAARTILADVDDDAC